MNKLTTIIGAAFLAISFNANAGDCPALSGDYTIGKTDADFSSMSEAISAMKCGGVSGAVTFSIEDGTYNERIVMSNIDGASAFNTITFHSKSGSNAGVVISSTGGDATMTMNGTSWVAFENITIDHKNATYGSAVKVDGKASHIAFKSVVFDGVEVTKAGANAAVINFTANAAKSDITIEDCEINNGSIGIAKAGMSAEEADSKTTISGTLFFNQYEAGMALKNEDAPMITNNVVSSLSACPGYKAISLDNATNNVVVSNNIINATNGTYGLAMNNCGGKATNMGQINNNSIAVGNTGEAYGLYLSGNTDNQVLNYNRVKLTINGTQASNQAYYRNTGSGNNVNMMNNIFYDLNTGGYTIIGNTYKDHFNQLPGQGNPALSASANGLMIEKVSPIK